MSQADSVKMYPLGSCDNLLGKSKKDAFDVDVAF